jgi:hypothetical protein
MASAVVLEGEARDVALAEAQAVLALVSDPERRERLRSLVGAADEGAVDGEDADALEELLELGLTTGRLRALYGPGGEQAALQTYRRLPSGAAAAKSAREVTSALAALVGERLEAVSVSVLGPGSFSLSLGAAGREVTVRLDRSGVRVASVGA